MPRLSIDGREVDVPEGETLLDASRRLGVEIPTLCFRKGLEPSTSCMVCVVKLKGPDRFVPSCATIAASGMVVESDTDEVRAMRRAALELLLSDHRGDCVAPCTLTCPAHMDIPLMIRQIAEGDLRGAIATVKEHIALPAVLGRICPAPCEKACRRKGLDDSVAICLLKRFAADSDLSQAERYSPPRKPPTGRRVAVVGSGPAGLAAAYYLLREGHACTVFEERELPGGALRCAVGAERLPPDVLDAECSVIEKMGARFVTKTAVERAEDLRRDFDAVVVATGALEGRARAALGLPVAGSGIEAEKRSFRTPVEGVFAAGSAVRPGKLAVRAVAEGRSAAIAVAQFLAGGRPVGPEEIFTTRLGKLTDQEMAEFCAGSSRLARTSPSTGGQSGFTREEAVREAGRCLHCDCRKASSCRLRAYARAYGADPGRYEAGSSGEEAEARRFQRVADHPFVVYEKGKCIKCGLCVKIAEAARERLGLAFIGRGFAVRVAVPFGRTLAEGLAKVAQDCVEACPTGALAARK